MNYYKTIPNLITFSRILASIILFCIIGSSKELSPSTVKIFTIIIITAYIYLSDVLDGFLARHFHVSSPLGAKIDILADLFYILSQILLLAYQRKIHIILVILVVVEFTIFITTSHHCCKITGIKKVWFDKIGRFTAIYYYIMPLSYFLLSLVNINFLNNIFNILCWIFTITAIISRIRICNTSIKQNTR